MRCLLKNNSGFTLLELMVILAIISILAAVAIPSYQSYARRAIAAQAQQEMQKIAVQLERHKSRNFSYQGFDASYLYKNSAGTLISNFVIAAQQLTLPIDGSSIRYTLTIVDPSTSNVLTATAATGKSWAIRAISADPANYTLLLTSEGLRCKSKTSNNNVTYTSCGASSENW